MQSYFECFLLIEKENNILKLKLEKINANMSEQSAALESLKQTQEASTIEEQLKEPTNIKENLSLDKISMEHIDAELNNAQKTVDNFISAQKSASNEELIEKEMSKQDYETLKHDFDELELEKKTLQAKLTTIEAALGRWIFRACDHKVELNKLLEKSNAQEALIENLNKEMALTRVDKESLIEVVEKRMKKTNKNLQDMTLLLSEKGEFLL